MKRKIATLGETDITVHPAAGILLLLGLLTRWRALLICTYASIILHETGVLTDMHFHICAADGTNGHERCGNAAIFLTAYHFPHGRLVVV